MTEEAKKDTDIETQEEKDTEDDGTRLTWDGYSAEIIGWNHIPRTDYESIVEIERDSRYRIRLSNSNDHMCMVKIELDGVFIGKCITLYVIFIIMIQTTSKLAPWQL